MTTVNTTTPLRYHTPALWADQASLDIVELLNDHVHLEKKAAYNAMSLLSACPSKHLHNPWHQQLIEIALEEAQHMQRTHKLLLKYGGQMSLHHKNPYATALNQLVQKGQTPLEQADRLLISALIEARSCERFGLLIQSSAPRDVQKLYQSFYDSEQRHFESFFNLACALHGQEQIEPRWQWLLEQEAAIIQEQKPGCRIHSGYNSDNCL